MCTLVILLRPADDWPLIIAANRDEMADRPWKAPARHWPDRNSVTAGLDELAGGTWLGVNDDGLAAAILNRPNTLSPKPGYRSRGELPLEVLDHAEAEAAAVALSHIEPKSYRAFNLVIADASAAFWLCSRNGTAPIEVREIPPGLGMITAHDLNDPTSARIRHYLPLFRKAGPPDPETGDWAAWQGLLAGRDHAPDAGPAPEPESAINLVTERGFGTLSSSLIALPAPRRGEKYAARRRWLFAAGRPGEAPYLPIAL
jgi:hypothetical protein